MFRDLSERHELLTDLFQVPKKQEDWEQYRLSKEQVEFFHENGFVGGIRVLPEESCDRLIAELNELMDSKHPGNSLFHEFHSNESADKSKTLFHALGAWRIGQYFHDLLWHPAVAMAAAQLLGGPVRFWHDQLFCKPAKHGGVVAWHQDYSYWTRTQPLAHITCWVALDASDAENGGIHYVPGSHRWDLLPITGLAGDMNAIRTVLTPEQLKAFDKRTPIPMKKGECTFHHALTVHGSYENRSETRPRRGTVVNAFRDGVFSSADEPLLAGVPILPTGQKMEGQFFPLLFDETRYRAMVGEPTALPKQAAHAI